MEPGTNPGFLYQQNTLRDALVAGITLNVLNQHSDRVRGANIAQTINVLQAMVLTRDDKMVLTPTYHVFEMFKVHQDATSLPVAINCAGYVHGDESIPAVSVSASRDKAGKVHLSLCSLDPNRGMDVACTVRGFVPSGVTGRILTAEAINAHNTFEHPDVVQPAPFGGAQLAGESLSIALPPRSVVVLALS